MIKISSQFINDATQRLPIHDPRNDIGCAVIADLSVWLMFGQSRKATFGTVPIWPEDSYFPRNRIGLHILSDDRRTKQIERCRVGTSTQFLKIV